MVEKLWDFFFKWGYQKSKCIFYILQEAFPVHSTILSNISLSSFIASLQLSHYQNSIVSFWHIESNGDLVLFISIYLRPSETYGDYMGTQKVFIE